MDTSKQGALLGVGAQGEVRSVFYNTQNRPGIPNSFEAGRKFDTNEANDEARGSGIPKSNPEEAKRAVATYETAKKMGLNVIPPTIFIFGENPKTGKQELGQAMERVKGTDGQKKVTVRPLTQDEIDLYVGDPAIELPPDVELDRQNQTGRKFENRPVDVDLKNPLIQKELSDLQLLDNVVGHADRHPGNFRFEGTGPGNITGVRGIDNDDTH